MPRKPSRKTLKNKCDVAFSWLIRQRGRCEMCRSPLNLQCSHIISRKYTQVRWDPDNAICACARCHRWQHDFPAHNGIWLAKYLGEDHLDRIRERSRRTTKLDYEEVLHGLQRLLRESEMSLK